MAKTYEVVGDAIVHGFRKGETFVAELAAHEEALLVEAGHIRRKRSAPVEPEAPAPSESPAAGK